MSHPEQLQFVKSVTELLKDGLSAMDVIEIGSYNVNGSVRELFPKSNYTGVDLIEGPGVDLVSNGDKILLPDCSFDLALSCECFEHNPDWQNTFLDMYRLTRAGGAVVFTCATEGRPEHGTVEHSPDASPGTQAFSWNYYRNLVEEDFLKIFKMEELFAEHFFMTNRKSCDLYFVGIKGREKNKNINMSLIKEICSQDQETLEKKIRARRARERYIPKPLRVPIRKGMRYIFSSNGTSRIIESFK